MLNRVKWKLTLPFQQSHIAPNLIDRESRTGSKRHQIEVQTEVNSDLKNRQPVLGLTGRHEREIAQTEVDMAGALG